MHISEFLLQKMPPDALGLELHENIVKVMRPCKACGLKPSEYNWVHSNLFRAVIVEFDCCRSGKVMLSERFIIGGIPKGGRYQTAQGPSVEYFWAAVVAFWNKPVRMIRVTV